MEKMSQKIVNKAMHDSGFFKKLEPAQMMHVLISDIIRRGDVMKTEYEYWLTQEERWPEITPEEKMDEVLRVLSEINPTAALQGFQKVGFMAFCMPKCFPIKKLMDKKNFYDIIDNFDKLEIRRDDLAFKLALLMFSFDPLKTEETLRDADFDEGAIDWICNMIYYYMDFIRLNSEKKLKAFVAKFGVDFYFDMNDYAWQVYKITNMNELKPLESKSHVMRMINQGMPLDISDLKLTAEDIIEAGAESQDEVFAIQHILLDDCLKKPENNDRELQLAAVRNLTQKQIDKKIDKLYRERERR